MRELGFAACGWNPTAALIAAALERDPGGEYVVAGAENLPFEDACFDLVVSYLSLVDIEHLDAAFSKARRVLKPGGAFLIANLSSINTAGEWQRGLLGDVRHYAVDNYMEERQVRQRWAGVDIVNWHRPFSTYFSALLGHGFVLKSFHEPMPTGQWAGRKPKFQRVPNFVVMLWTKPT